MKHFSAQYIFTNNGQVLRRAVITTDDDGIILDIVENDGHLKEESSVEFYNGIIIPGFVNCHCHLELSHMKGSISKWKGLGGFIEEIRNTRNNGKESIVSAASGADRRLRDEGIVLCADICNTSDTFEIKKDSTIAYINLLEVFGIDPEKAEKRLSEILKVAETAKGMELPYTLVPHSAYSLSVTLMKLLKKETLNNSLTSIHFMESNAERIFLNEQSGELLTSYERSGLIPSRFETVNHLDSILNEITDSGNLILVHNTFVDLDMINALKKRSNLYWCLCPNSNLYIENVLPPINLLRNEACKIVVGTDSLASNSDLSILEELKTISENFPDISLPELITWGTCNGAEALGRADQFGRIIKGTKPGLLLLENTDLQNLKLLAESSVKRLI